MSINQERCYTVTCDLCELDLEDDYILHFPSATLAEDAVRVQDWIVVGDKVACDSCQPVFCTCEHDYRDHDGACNECDCAAFRLEQAR